MKICLIRPPALIDKKGFAIDPTPPLGLAYIASAILSNDFEVQVIDAVGESPKQYNEIEFIPNITNEYKKGRLFTNGLRNDEIADLVESDVSIIGLSCMFSNNWLADRELISRLRKKHPDLLIIAGGESITSYPKLWMTQAPGLDFCILGEGEATIVDFLKTIKESGDISEVGGIAYRCENEIVISEKRKRIIDIDSISKPAWHLFPLDNYEKYRLQYTVTSRKSLPILATRGCPYKCTFCSNPLMWGTRYVMRSPVDVADEIEEYIIRYNIEEFDFYDLTAIIKKKWIIEFAKEIIQRNLCIIWNLPAGTRSEVIDEEVARYLYLSGCRNITYAPESGSNKMLKLIKKKVSLDNMLKSIQASNNENMKIYLNVILALPGETHKDIWQTLWFLVKCSYYGAYEVGIAMFHPYPGSELFEELHKNGKIKFDNDDFFYNTITISPLNDCEYHYNVNVSPKMYSYYNIAAYFIFFGSNYLFRPKRLLKFLRNVSMKKYSSRFERTISSILYREKHKAESIS